MQAGRLLTDIWRRLFLQESQEAAPRTTIEHLIESIVRERPEPVSCRLRITEYPGFAQSLAQRLGYLSLPAPDLSHALRGKLVGVCPECETRMSVEYLEWLRTVEDTSSLTGSRVRKLVRFAEGRCVNELCSARDLTLYWHPPR